MLKRFVLIVGAWQYDPAAFRRLCVETLTLCYVDGEFLASRLQAAVC